jgi:outer membrane protein assembly factor BamB
MDQNPNESVSRVPIPAKPMDVAITADAPGTPSPNVSLPAASVARPLRLWPAVVIIALQWLVVKTVSWVAPATMAQFMTMFLAPLVGTGLLAVWWLFFSRLRWVDRILGLVVFAAAGAVAYSFFHPSLGMFGLFLYALPAAATAWVAWLVVTPMLTWRLRRLGLAAVMILAWGFFILMRFDGANGQMQGDLSFRWTPTPEDKFGAEVAAGRLGAIRGVDPKTAKPLTLQPGDWPGFRGPNRDGHLMGVKIATDWDKNPPKLVWRHLVGPGWGSFSVIGSHVFTQEQWGDDEAVVCYDAATGEIIWAHKDPARFTEPVAGAGPRATPTFHEGKLYTQGAAGKLNCFEAATGEVRWSRDILADSGGQKPPDWGFAGSPLVVQGVVSIFAGGPEGKSVLGYNASTGDLVWHAGEGQLSYCSPHPTHLGGVEQLVISTDKGLTAFNPPDGHVLWSHAWELDKMARVVQPTVVDNADLLLGTGFNQGTRRVHIAKDGGDWAAKEVWTSRAIAPYFNDLVVHDGHLYGFHGDFFTCVRLSDGKAKWKERGYGNGQVLFLADQNVLLIVTETGEVALVEASPDSHKELGRFQAIEGKTWNHPVVAHGMLFVRNGAEAACFKLNEIGGSTR